VLCCAANSRNCLRMIFPDCIHDQCLTPKLHC
jgi:hypothetical protein